MDQEKRVLLAFALSFAVLLVWRAFFAPPPAKAPLPAPPAPTQAQSAGPPSQPRPTASSAAPTQLRVTQGSKRHEIIVEGGDLYKVTLDTQGAVVKSWVLTKYRDEKENPLDVVDGAACESLGFPLSLSLADADLSKKLNSALFVATPADSSSKAPRNLEFVYSDGKIEARKKIFFGPGYEVRAEVSVFDGERYLPVEVSWPGGFGDHSLAAKVKDSVTRAVYGTAEDLTTVAQGKVKEDRSIAGPLALAGLEDRYFAFIFFPGSPDQVFRIARRDWTPPDWKGEDKDKPRPMVVALGSPQPKPLGFRLFVAPKDLDVLRSVNPPLDRLVDFGWFSVVAKPLFVALRYVYDHWIHNYGWAIVLLTIIINLAMFPLKLKSLRSAQEMQRVQPQVKAIQERYKQYKFNDPRKQRMNQEVMKLYQEHGINPLGGCLPMALQLPFLYGFYNVLSQAIELRHAAWTLWLKDLASPDPLYILPSVMVVTMFVLQKMTPMATADPAQQRMMMITPLIFGIMFFNFASGLVLYWLTGNIVGIAQQAFINRKLPGVRKEPGAPEVT